MGNAKRETYGDITEPKWMGNDVESDFFEFLSIAFGMERHKAECPQCGQAKCKRHSNIEVACIGCGEVFHRDRTVVGEPLRN